jgi:hypothetical protein
MPANIRPVTDTPIRDAAHAGGFTVAADGIRKESIDVLVQEVAKFRAAQGKYGAITDR